MVLRIWIYKRAFRIWTGFSQKFSVKSFVDIGFQLWFSKDRIELFAGHFCSHHRDRRTVFGFRITFARARVKGYRIVGFGFGFLGHAIPPV